MAQSVTDGIEGSKIKLGVDSSIPGLGVVADKLADIAASFHSIISMLTSLGGLSIPPDCCWFCGACQNPGFRA